MSKYQILDFIAFYKMSQRFLIWGCRNCCLCCIICQRWWFKKWEKAIIIP